MLFGAAALLGLFRAYLGGNRSWLILALIFILPFFILFPYQKHLLARSASPFTCLYAFAAGGLIAFSAHFMPLSFRLFALAFTISLQIALTGAWGRCGGLFFGLGYLTDAYLAYFWEPLLAGEGFQKWLPDLPALAVLEMVAGLTLAVTESTYHLRRLLLMHSQRLQVTNQVAEALSRSIEPRAVKAALKQVFQRSFNADTYFLAILEKGRLRLDLLYDEGHFFPVTYLPAQDGLAGWVLRHRRSLLIHDLAKALPELKVHPRVVGKRRHSVSWMGTPLEAGGELLGVIAVAAYRPKAFSEEDLALLENIARQAALALSNAFHHAEAERQARSDPLTGVLNHQTFLQEAQSLLQRCLRRPCCGALIMIDIDHFKHFNDRYGHLAGDEVLRQVARTIRRHIKRMDLVGRWGGEEFVVALPKVNGIQALQVARRIRQALRELRLEAPEGDPIPPPTVSQGIALFPSEAAELYAVLHLADQRLYRAKARGRDQICPASADIWPPVDREGCHGSPDRMRFTQNYFKNEGGAIHPLKIESGARYRRAPLFIAESCSPADGIRRLRGGGSPG